MFIKYEKEKNKIEQDKYGIILNKKEIYYKELEDKNNNYIKSKIENFMNEIKSDYESHNKLISLNNSEIYTLSNQQISDQMLEMALPLYNQLNIPQFYIQQPINEPPQQIMPFNQPIYNSQQGQVQNIYTPPQPMMQPIHPINNNPQGQMVPISQSNYYSHPQTPQTNNFLLPPFPSQNNDNKQNKDLKDKKE